MNNHTRCRAMLAAALACLLAVSFACTSKSDLTGKWKGNITLEQGGSSLSDVEFDLVQKAGNLTGTMVFTKVAGGRINLQGTRSSDDVTFTTPHTRGLSVVFAGTVISGSHISGKATLMYSDPKVPVKQDIVALELTR
jgi:hypothetical protein